MLFKKSLIYFLLSLCFFNSLTTSAQVNPIRKGADLIFGYIFGKSIDPFFDPHTEKVDLDGIKARLTTIENNLENFDYKIANSISNLKDKITPNTTRTDYNFMALSAINEISNRVLELESRVDVNSSKIDGLEHRLANAELALLELRSVLEKPEPPSLEVYSSPGFISKVSSNDANLISVKNLCKTPLNFKLDITYSDVKDDFEYEFDDFPPLSHYILGYEGKPLNFLKFKGFKDWEEDLKRFGKVSSDLQVYGKSGKYYTPLWDKSHYNQYYITYVPSIRHYTIIFICSNELPNKPRDAKNEVLVRLITNKKYSTGSLLNKKHREEQREYDRKFKGWKGLE